MIQIYKADNTDFDKNGDMTLLPSEATVHVILNGEWTANIEHPIDAEGRWKHIAEEAVIKMPSFNGEQLFRIKKVEKTDSGIVAEAQPIFMDAKDDCFLLDIRPTDKTGQQALDIMTAPNKKYKAISDINLTSTAYYMTKNLIEAISAEDENSFINRWGGEVIYDNHTVIINERAGGDYGVEVLYGKNIQADGFSEEIDVRDVVTRIVPKGYNGCMIEGNRPWVDSALIGRYPTIRYGVIEFEDIKMREDAQDGDEEDGIIICDTAEELKEALTKKCEEQFDAGLDKPKITISADIILLEGTDLYQDIEDLVKASIGDTVHCRHSKLGIVTDARVIEMEWDCIRKTPQAVVLGDLQYNYIDDVTSMINRVESAIRSDGSVIGQQVQGIINGVKAQLKAQSTIAKKQEVRAMLFEDLDPESPTYGAMCMGTMGFQIASKRTADGREWDWSTFGTGRGFFADFIVAGTMLADRIKGGTLELGGADNGNGVARVFDENGKEVIRLDKGGVYAKGKYICDGTDGWDGRAQIRNGGFMISDKSEKNGIVISYADGGLFFRYGGTPEDATEATDIMSLKKDSVTIFVDGFAVGAKSGKTGKVEFSDGTYLEFKGGILTGGDTREGAF